MSKTLKASLRKGIVGIVMMTTIFSLSGVTALIPAAQAATIVDGDTIRNPSAAGDAQFDVYIVKLAGAKKFKRLVLNPAVFDSYGHLKWENVKLVTTEEMNAFKTSAIVRVETDPKVLALAPNGDAGSKSWLNVTAADFVAAGGDWDSVYVINTTDGANYAAAGDLTTQTQVSTFLTAGTLPGPVSTTGAITVAVAAENPGSTTLTLGSVGNKVLAFAVTAPSDGDAVLNSVKFKRVGVGLATDYSTVYIYDGETRLKTGKSISSDTNTVEFTGIGLTIAKGTTKVLTVKADTTTSAASAGDINIITIQAATDIAFTSGTVSGTFPISGNGMNIGAQTVGTAIIANGAGTISKATLGQVGAKLANFKVTAGVNDIEVRSVTLVQNGSFANSNITNLTVKNSIDNAVLGTTAKMTGEKAVITLTTPFAITKSQNKTFDLYGDLSGGRTTDTIRFYLEESTDIVVIDKQYGQGSIISSTFGSTGAFCVGNGVNACTVSSLQGGAITLADNGPAATTVANNTTNADLLKFSITSTRNVTVKDYGITLTATNKANSTITDPAVPATMVIGTESETLTSVAHGLSVGDYIILNSSAAADAYSTTVDIIGKVTTVATANTFKITPVSGTDLSPLDDSTWSTIARVDVVRLTDTDTNNVIYSSSTVRYFYAGALTSAIAASDDFDVNAGQTRHLALRVDINSYTSGGMTLNSLVDFNDASTIKDNDANEYIAVADVVPGTLTGKNMTTGAAGLTVALASTPVSATKVKGTQNVDILGVSLASGSSSKSKITNLVVRFVADVDATFTAGTGDTAANTLVTSASLYDGATQVGTSKTLVAVGYVSDTSGYYKATFDNLAYEVAAGASNKLTVRVNLNSTLADNTYLAADINAATDIVAQDKDGNALTIAGTGISRATQTTTTLNPVFLISTAGTLSVNVEGAPSAAIVVGGATSVVMAKYKASALNEAFTIEKLSVASSAGTGDFVTESADNDNDLVRVGVRAGGVTTWANVTAGVANFSGLSINVPVNGSTYIEVLADLNTIADGATTGESPRLGLYQAQSTANIFRAIGVGSSTEKTFTTLLNTTVTGEENIKAMVLRKTTPTVVKVSGLSTTLVNAENTLFGFTVAADAGAAVSLKRIALIITNSDITTPVTGKNFKLFRGTTNITDQVLIYKPGASLGTVEGAGSPDAINAASSTIYIVWDGTTEETISAGGSNTYYVKATVAGATTNKSIGVYIADDETALTTTDAVTAIGGLYDGVTDKYYHATGTTVAVGDTRITAVDSHTGVATATTAGNGDATAATVQTKYDDADATATLTFTFTSAVASTVTGETGWTAADIAGGTTIVATNTDGRTLTITVSGTYAANDTIVVVVTNNDGGYTSGSPVLVAQSDIGLTVTASVAAGTVRNFVWSDNSSTSHNITSSVDWTNGYLVNDLSTGTQTLTY